MVLGSQSPRIEHVPAGRPHADAEAALEFAEAAGFGLQSWQEHVLERSLHEKPDAPKWAAFDVGVDVPRQNGKTELALVRLLAGAYVLEEMLLVYTAHLARTAEEVFRRAVNVLEMNDDLMRDVKHIWRANGRESIELKSGARIQFQTRTLSSGRGFAKASCVVLDEAMYFPTAAASALIPILSRAPNPQLWWLGSSVDQLVHQDGEAFTRLRARALSGDDPSLAYFEWSAPYESPGEVPAEVISDPAAWAAANPAYGQGLSEEHVANEQRTLDPRTFAVERLGVGDWPPIGDDAGMVIGPELWAGLADAAGQVSGSPVFAFAVSPDRAWASVGVCGQRPDGLYQVEVIEHKRGTGWLPDLLAERPADSRVVCFARGPAGSVIPGLEARGVTVEPLADGEYVAACGAFYDAAVERTVRHLNDPLLAATLRAARKRASGAAWKWDHKGSVDISPLEAVTLALWGVQSGSETQAWFGGW